MDYETLGTHVYIWIGTTYKSETEYYEYYKLDYTYELDDQDYRVCEFCKDVGEKWYDEDFIFLQTPLEKEVNIIDLLEDTIVLDKEHVIQKCNELGIKKANAIFGYATPDDHYKEGCLYLSHPYKDSYNGLKYIGRFLHD